MIALVVAILTEESPSAAVTRGDFPAFYTLAYLAEQGEGVRLYDLEAQRRFQNSVWPSLSGSVLPAAYPAYLAFFLQPLALLDATTARAVWALLMAACVVGAVMALARHVPTLKGLGWRLGVVGFLFGPLFVGVVGGQIVGLSLLCYALLLALSQRRDHRNEILAGIVAGVWMVKPHFGLGAAAIFLCERRWLALGVWCGVSLVLWVLGVSVVDVGWVGQWIHFARQFSEIDLATNAYQMTGVVGFLYSISRSCGVVPANPSTVWDTLSITAACFVPVCLFLSARCRRCREFSVSLPWLVLGPLLVLFAPVVNFYDLSLALVPLLVLFRSDERRDFVWAAGVLIASQIVVVAKESALPGVSFTLALGMALLCLGAVRREGSPRCEM